MAGIVQGQTTVTVQAGASFATWGGFDVAELEEEGLDYGYRTGLAFRASAILPLSDLLGLQVGAAYVQKGVFAQARGDEFGIEFDFELTATMGYLDLPVLLRVSPKLEGPVSPYVAAGPALSFWLNCSLSSSYTSTYTDYTGEEVMISESETPGCNNDGELKRLDFGVTAGVGVAFAVSPSLSLTLDLLYDHGLVSVDKETEFRNRAFAIMAGVAFPIR